MASAKDKMEFVFAMGRHSTASLYDCKLIMRYAAVFQYLAVEDCNRELTDAERNKRLRTANKLLAVCTPLDIKPKWSGDPRGCVVKLVVPDGYTNDMGREGICVPA